MLGRTHGILVSFYVLTTPKKEFKSVNNLTSNQNHESCQSSTLQCLSDPS